MDAVVDEFDGDPPVLQQGRATGAVGDAGHGVEEVGGDGGAGADRLQGPAAVGVDAADGGDPAANRRPPQRSERPHTAALY
ncbi:hypothetical protein ACFC26_12150 [Kitasatospora purpeofusca]|uniref:hypothetical protein n=1 Tax=Kitasatospora purpeofusca TaxID=67352 RepID=UPI0035D9CDAA